MTEEILLKDEAENEGDAAHRRPAVQRDLTKYWGKSARHQSRSYSLLIPKSSSDLIVLGKKVRQDRQSGYICLTDLSALKGDGRFHIANWLRAVTTIRFIEEWERKFNPNFNVVEIDYIKDGMGENTFTRSAQDFIRAGCIGIFSRSGRYGGTYAEIHWAIHFANSLDPRFYLETLSSHVTT